MKMERESPLTTREAAFENILHDIRRMSGALLAGSILLLVLAAVAFALFFHVVGIVDHLPR